MKHISSFRLVYSPAILLLSLASSSMAALVTSIDFTPLEGSWASPTTAPIRVDFGNGIGTGTIAFSAFDGGSITVASSSYNGESYTGFDLGNGNVLDLTNEIIFSFGGGSDPLVYGGVQMTVTLDNATPFTDGSIFAVRSLDTRVSGLVQQLQLVSGLSAPLAQSLDSDFGLATIPMTELSPGIYGSASPGASKGRAFEIEGNTFTVKFASNGNYSGGVAMSIATAVPEPSTWVFSLAALSGLLVRRRR